MRAPVEPSYRLGRRHCCVCSGLPCNHIEMQLCDDHKGAPRKAEPVRMPDDRITWPITLEEYLRLTDQELVIRPRTD